MPTFLFFDSLKRREFPTTITIRDSQKLNYLPEPDIFHDIAGHVPMHTDKAFADVLVKFGSIAEVAAKCHAYLTNEEEEKMNKINSNTQALARFFWFTIKFGPIRKQRNICVYSSGLLSSADKIEYCIMAKEVQRHPFQLEWVINQSFEYGRFQPLLFIVDSFNHLYEEVKRLEEWLLSRQLDNVSPGKPEVSENDLKVFLQQGSKGAGIP